MSHKHRRGNSSHGVAMRRMNCPSSVCLHAMWNKSIRNRRSVRNCEKNVCLGGSRRGKCPAKPLLVLIFRDQGQHRGPQFWIRDGRREQHSFELSAYRICLVCVLRETKSPTITAHKEKERWSTKSVTTLRMDPSF